jgi:hypothetical protein
MMGAWGDDPGAVVASVEWGSGMGWAAFLEGPAKGVRRFAVAMGGEETAAMLPEQGPDLFPIGGWQAKRFEFATWEEGKASLTVGRGKMIESGQDLEEEHQPVGLTLIPAFTHHRGEVEIRGGDLDAQFLESLPTGAGVGGFADILMQFASAGAPEPAIGFLGTLQQQDIVRCVEAVEKRRNLVGQAHGQRMTADAGAGKLRINP